MTSAFAAHSIRCWRWDSPATGIFVSAFVASFLGVGWTTGGYFLSEDFANVIRFSEFPAAAIPKLFASDWSGGIWRIPLPELRPIIAISFILDFELWGASPTGFRLTNLLVHAFCAAMVGLIARRLLGFDDAAGRVAAVLFALHPVNSYAVVPICGRGDLIAACFYFMGFIAFLKYRERNDVRWLALLVLSYLLSAFSKEYGFTLIAVMLVTDGTWLDRTSQWRKQCTWLPYLCCAVVAAVYFCCRLIAFGNSTAGAKLNPQHLVERLGSYHRGYVFELFPSLAGLKSLLRGVTSTIESGWALQFAIMLSIYAVIIIGFWRNRRGRSIRTPKAPILFCAGWYLVTTGLFVLTYFAPRHLYLASAGLCFAIVVMLRGATRSRYTFTAGAIALIALYGFQLTRALQPWVQAANVSRTAMAEFDRAARKAAPGSAIVISVPGEIETAVCWAWALPFATQPPFITKRPDETVAVIGAPDIYAFPEQWQAQPAIASLPKVSTESHFIRIDADGKVLRAMISPDRMRRAGLKLKDESGRVAPNEAWRGFVTDLVEEITAPPLE